MWVVTEFTRKHTGIVLQDITGLHTDHAVYNSPAWAGLGECASRPSPFQLTARVLRLTYISILVK
jgi:hypothetical protein